MDITARLAEISDEAGMTFTPDDAAYLADHDLHQEVTAAGFVLCTEDNGGNVYVRLSDGHFMVGWPESDGNLNLALWDSFFNPAYNVAEFIEIFDELWGEYEAD